jgi:hypothetical protein
MKSLFPILGIAASGAIQVTLATPYGVPASTADAGGTHAASASYQHDGSVGGIAGVSTVAAPAETAKHGYLAQLYEVAGLQLAASPTSVDEGNSRQLQAVHLLDDATTVVADAGSVAWSVLSGPIESVSASGLATAGTVYQNTNATIQGDLGGFTATLGLTVLNVGQDDFQAYAADGIDDDWQVQYFGAPPNANAGPAADPDGDGQKNLFEFLAGVIPNDSASRFHFRIEPVAGQPAQKKLVFSPRLAGRTYAVETNADLGAAWSPLSGATVSDAGSERTVTDPNASAAKKFYRVNITKP